MSKTTEEGQDTASIDAEVNAVVVQTNNKKGDKKKDVNPKAVQVSQDHKAAKRELLDALYGLNANSLPAGQKQHTFWNTQPVRENISEIDASGEVETKTIADVRATPLKLPPSFEWVNCDMKDEKVRTEVYNLLTENYVEDNGCMFRFNYSKEFLAWALLVPEYMEDLHLGIRMKGENNMLMAFISGIPVDMQVYKHTRKMIEINFLCIHKALRSKRLAPVLIKEITRRTNLKNIWQAVYTAGVTLPQPVARNRYYHRSLNPKKLVDVKFSGLKHNMTLQRLIKLNRLPNNTVTPGFRLMEEKDINQAHSVLMSYLKKFQLYQKFTVEEFQHWFLPRKDIIYSYVVEDPASKKITDFLSFYCLPSTIIGHHKYNQLRAVYSFYNVANSCSWEQLMKDGLICAKNLDFDVYNCLDVMENTEFLKKLLFGQGDGNLQYYLYNWKCPEMKVEDVGLVLL